MTSEYLQFRGFRVEEAATGIEALEKATALLPDVVLLDLLLPDMSGLEAVSRLRQSERTKNLSIALLTAQVLDGDRQRTAAAGVHTFILKPCDLGVLALQLAYLVAQAARD